MNEIFNRRSVRKYLPDDAVSDSDIIELLRAAMRAPSAGNEQPWEFVVLRDRETISSVIEFHPYAAFLKQTPCLIVICGDINSQKYEYDFWTQDCSAATQNLLLEATHLGLGAVWLGIHPVPERVEGMSKLLQLPENVIPFSAVSVGHPVTKPKPLDTFKEDKIHFETWQSR